jgi:hypothetical protein
MQDVHKIISFALNQPSHQKGIGQIKLQSKALFMNKSYNLMYVSYYITICVTSCKHTQLRDIVSRQRGKSSADKTERSDVSDYPSEFAFLVMHLLTLSLVETHLWQTISAVLKSTQFVEALYHVSCEYHDRSPVNE